MNRAGNTPLIVLSLLLFLTTCSLSLSQGPEEEEKRLASEIGELRKKGHFSDAIALAKRALDSNEAAFGPDHPSVGRSLTLLAHLHRDMGDYGSAVALYKRSLAIAEKSYGPESRNVARALRNLAGVYQASRDYVGAEPLLTRAVEILEKTLDPDHPDLAACLSSLGQVYHSMKAMPKLSLS